jgi:CheY-like chemotaxis protein
MPVMDGGTSIQRIREYEDSSRKQGEDGASNRKYINNGGRIPVFATSATLLERRRLEYMQLGFDGWILKPVDFKRLETLLKGSRDKKVRIDAEYIQGYWERGGWFLGACPN